jgi:HEAT repeat protein
VSRLQQQITALEARLRARQELAAVRPSTTASPDRTAPTPTEARVLAEERAKGRASGQGAAAAAPTEQASTAAAAKAVQATPATVQTAMDKFYRFMESMAGLSDRERFQKGRELVEELRALGPAGGQALMQILGTAKDTDERRAAARMLGALQFGQAVPLLRDVIDKDSDLLLRRTAAWSLQRLQSPDAVPVMERLVSQPSEDRIIRLSAATGLAEAGKPLGVSALTHIFDEAAADGRGREGAFRALRNLKDEQSVPFMRQVIGSQVEPGYRLQAIRYLSEKGDKQALPQLQVIMSSPTEQPSIRDAAAQAHSVISAGK